MSHWDYDGYEMEETWVEEHEAEPTLENGDVAYCWVKTEDGEITELLSAEVDGKELAGEELAAFDAKYRKTMQDDLNSKFDTWSRMDAEDRATRRAESGYCD